MELMAAISALNALKEPCEVDLHTDSKYVKDGISGWIHGWKRNGWKTAAKKPVKNAELWQALDEASKRHKVTWHWVKGHAGHVENERADELARMGMAPFKPEEAPQSPADAVGGRCPRSRQSGVASGNRATCQARGKPRSDELPRARVRGSREPSPLRRRAADRTQSCSRICAAPDSSTPGFVSTLSAVTSPSSTIIEKRLRAEAHAGRAQVGVEPGGA